MKIFGNKKKEVKDFVEEEIVRLMEELSEASYTDDRERLLSEIEALTKVRDHYKKEKIDIDWISILKIGSSIALTFAIMNYEKDGHILPREQFGIAKKLGGF